MRTTLRIDDDLYRAVKALAARAGRTVGEVVEDALRRALSASTPGMRPSLPALPVYGSGGVLSGIDLTSNSELRDVMDAGKTTDALR